MPWKWIILCVAIAALGFFLRSPDSREQFVSELNSVSVIKSAKSFKLSYLN